MRLVDKKAFSITFLDAPSVQGPGRLDRDYEDVAAQRGVPESLVERLHESIGFEPPSPHDRAGEDDLALLDVMELFRSVAVPDEAVVRVSRSMPRPSAGSPRPRPSSTRQTSRSAFGRAA